LCFDVGANIGEVSEAMLESGARVVAFEPNPRVLPELVARCGHHPRWSVVSAALGGGAAIATLHLKAAHGQSSLDAGWGGRTLASVNVPVVTLDAAIRAYGVPYYVKVDVEGWEPEVLRGLSEPVPLLSVEFHLSETSIAKTRTCLDRLLELGAYEANVTPAESAALHLPAWAPLKAFAASFPGDLRDTLPGDRYGDIFVRATTA
jgi:FkbM family methyltransferase